MPTNSCRQYECQNKSFHISLQELQKRILDLTNLLRIHKNVTSLYQRSKSSAYDGRISSKSIGFTGVAVLVSVVLLVSSLGVSRYSQWLNSKRSDM